MPAKSNETTRLLCASAYLAGASFRSAVLEHFENEHCAISPEIGVDFDLVRRVCESARRRMIFYCLAFVGLLLIAGISFLTTSLDQATFTGILMGVFSGILFFIKTYQEQYSLIFPFQRKNYDYEKVANKYVSSSLKPADASAKDQDLVVYGGFLPFVGAGVDFGGWSFALSTIKSNDDVDSVTPVPFKTSDLYVDLEAGLHSLGIEEMKVDDYYFVSGRDIRSDREILPDEYGRPVARLSQQTGDQYKHKCDSRVRHYRWIRVEDWGGELVMSMFLRCTLRGSSLFVEMQRFLLTPVAEKYREVDKASSPTFGLVFSLFIGSLIAGPFYAVYAVFFLLGRLIHSLENLFGAADRKTRHEIRDNPLFDYGVQQSLRTKFSSGKYHHYFQKLDTDFYGKVLEREILDSIVAFLEDHHIDTSEIKERQKTILNSGIIVQAGGNVNAESLAVGAGAKAVKAGINAITKSKASEA